MGQTQTCPEGSYITSVVFQGRQGTGGNNAQFTGLDATCNDAASTILLARSGQRGADRFPVVAPLSRDGSSGGFIGAQTYLRGDNTRGMAMLVADGQLARVGYPALADETVSVATPGRIYGFTRTDGKITWLGVPSPSSSAAIPQSPATQSTTGQPSGTTSAPQSTSSGSTPVSPLEGRVIIVQPAPAYSPPAAQDWPSSTPVQTQPADSQPAVLISTPFDSQTVTATPVFASPPSADAIPVYQQPAAGYAPPTAGPSNPAASQPPIAVVQPSGGVVQPPAAPSMPPQTPLGAADTSWVLYFILFVLIAIVAALLVGSGPSPATAGGSCLPHVIWQ